MPIIFLVVLLAMFTASLVIISAFTPHVEARAADPKVMAAIENQNGAIMPAPNVIIQTVTPDTLNAAMKPDSQTIVTSIEPLPQTRAAIERQIVITQTLLGAGVFGWFDDPIDGEISYTCPDSLCRQYDPNRKVFLCGGWVGMGAYSQTVEPVFTVIQNIHICIQANRIAGSKNQQIGMLSASARRLLVGNTKLWPLLVIELYQDKAPYPIANPEGK